MSNQKLRDQAEYIIRLHTADTSRYMANFESHLNVTLYQIME